MASQHARALVICSIVLAAALSVVAIAITTIRIEVHSLTAGIVVVSARGMAELFAALLATQRFRRSGLRLDFGIAIALGTMAVADLAFALGRATLTGSQISPVAVMPYQVVGAAVLAVTAAARDGGILPRGRRHAVIAAIGIAAALLLLQQLRILAGTGVLTGAEPPAVVALRVATAALLAAAAAGFAWRTRAAPDPLVGWLAGAAVLGALAQLHRVVVPASASATTFGWPLVLQIAATAALLVGVIEETRGYQRRLAELAVADERRRIARDMHDGLAQDIAFISSQSRDLAEQSGDERLRLIADAAQRALDDSRFIIKALARASSQPLGASIALQAQEFVRRWGLVVDVSVREHLDVPPEKQQAILRIVGEALSNAARHAQATHVAISLEDRDGRLLLAIRDDGRGFDTERTALWSEGFGLQSMRERAELVGADLRLESRPGAGTRVELALS